MEKDDSRRVRAKTTGRPTGNRDLNALVAEAVLKAGSRRVADLAQELEVSEVSIRKSLVGLENKGLIRRFHGEARAYDGDAIPFRMGLHYQEKQYIAELAASLIKDGETIFIEAGSAAAFLAERLKDMRDLSVATCNLFIARIFRGSKVRVLVTGGSYQEESESLVGPLAIASVKELGFSKAFLGTSGYTQDLGFTLNDFQRAELSRTILARGADNYILTDSSKFGRAHAASFCSDPSLLQAVITDKGISNSGYQQPLRGWYPRLRPLAFQAS
ncbi:DNA-binding transcriptional regulator YciT [Treponema sp.]